MVIMNKNILVGQSGGPTAVINSSLAGVFCGGKELGAEKVFGMKYGIEGILKSEFYDMDELLKTEKDIELLKRTPASFLGSCRYLLPQPEKGNEIYEKLFKFFDEHSIGFVFYIGGNDSMDTVKKLYDYSELTGKDVKFIGIPKTIDNDLLITDHTPGYGSAAKYIATSVKELIRDGMVYDLKSVTVVEIMGRDSGWLTAAASLSKGDDCEGPDMVLLPERPFDADYIIQKAADIQKSKKSLVIAISEGLRTSDGRYICEIGRKTEKDAFGHTLLSASGAYLASIIKDRLKIKTRAVELSTLQRCASHISSLTDVNEAFMAGRDGVKAAFEGKSGEMIIFKRVSNSPYIMKTETADIHNIANYLKTVPDNMISKDGIQITGAFREYALPLIMGETEQYISYGTPRHIIAKG